MFVLTELRARLNRLNLLGFLKCKKMSSKMAQDKRIPKFFVSIVLLLTLVFGIFFFHEAASFIGKSFPGFLLREDLSVGFLNRSHWTGSVANLDYTDKIISINGNHLESTEDFRILFGNPKNHPITYKSGQCFLCKRMVR